MDRKYSAYCQERSSVRGVSAKPSTSKNSGRVQGASACPSAPEPPQRFRGVQPAPSTGCVDLPSGAVNQREQELDPQEEVRERISPQRYPGRPGPNGPWQTQDKARVRRQRPGGDRLGVLCVVPPHGRTHHRYQHPFLRDPGASRRLSVAVFATVSEGSTPRAGPRGEAGWELTVRVGHGDVGGAPRTTG